MKAFLSLVYAALGFLIADPGEPIRASVGNSPHVSVVIPCRDDTHLPATLASLAQQNHAPAFEVIVVDDSGHDPALGVVRFRDSLELRVVAARRGPRMGRTAMRASLRRRVTSYSS
jgi:cellulose synthase/poly-beta-1,6-N-acetylglucosamine synthase-like glycosyltransferase